MFKKNLDKNFDIAIFYAGFFLFLILLHIFLGMPVNRYANKLKAEFKSKESKLKESEGLIKSLPNPQKAIEDIEKKAQEFKDMGVSKKQLPRLIQLLGQSTSEHKLNVISIKPREDIKSGNENLPTGVTKVYIEMVASSPYQLFADYIKSLNELPVAFSIEAVTIEKKEQGPLETKRAPEKTEAKTGPAEELLCTLLLSTYMVWEL